MKDRQLRRAVRNHWWSLVELWDDIAPRRKYSWSPKPRRWMAFRGFMCREGLHWPIVFDYAAYPGSYDPPEPPEPGWCCDSCGKTFAYGNYRLQFRAWITPLWWAEWRVKRMDARDV